MRVILATTPEQLAAWAQAGEITEVSSAHAVTAALTDWFSGADTEELEYAALNEAAEASLKMLAAQTASTSPCGTRRVVLSADVEVMVATKQAEPRSLVKVPEHIPFSLVVSFHVDDDDAEALVAAAATALAAGATREQLQALLDEVAEYELMWFDRSELNVVLGLVTS